VLRHVDLELNKGEVVALWGANGAGKTTLFSILVGVLQHDAGERCFGGMVVSDVDEDIRAGMALVGHRPQLYPLLSARENLALFADLRATRGLEVEPPEVVLGRLGLSNEVIDRPVSTFSRGMAQRVSLARALAERPQLLVLDEPFTALDTQGRHVLAEALREEQKRGTAVILASHDLDAVTDVVDRVILLERGTIRAVASRDDGESDFSDRVAALRRRS